MLTSMNEIIIDQKKYISSKQAAEITGYAKDYVGQLCREGRVPARLVGRSWYVLESAIQDHRFGSGHDTTPKTQKIEEKQSEKESPLPPTWESPHYEAVHEDSLPQINRLKATVSIEAETKVQEEDNDAVTRMRESWKQWFADTSPEAPEIEQQDVVEEQQEVPEEPQPTEEPEVAAPEDEPVSIAIHAIHHPELTHSAPTDPAYEHVLDDTREAIDERTESPKKVSTYRALKALVYFIVLCSVVIASAGSGIMDKIIISDTQVGFIAGISVYNK